MTILIAEGMQESGIELFKKNKIKTLCLSDAYLKEEIEVLIVRSVFGVNEEALRQFPNLKMVAKLGTGLDNIGQDFCAKRSIKVLSVPGLNAVSTAEFTVMQILNIYKNIFEISEKVKGRDFRRALYYGRELVESEIMVIGYGSVGQNIVARLKPFAKKIYISDNHRKRHSEDDALQFVSDLNSEIVGCDVIVLALSLKNNEKMVNATFLSRLKKDVLLVNTARGGLIDEPALCLFLKQNPRAFYYCDVLALEPDYTKLPPEQDYCNPLLELPNVLFTPHIAGMTKECQRNIALEIARKVIAEQNPLISESELAHGRS